MFIEQNIEFFAALLKHLSGQFFERSVLIDKSLPFVIYKERAAFGCCDTNRSGGD